MTFGKELFAEIGRDDCLGLAGEMAYNLMLSLFPALIFLTALFGMLGSQIHLLPQIIDYVRQFAPREAWSLIEGTLVEIVRGGTAPLATVGLLGALWGGSNVVTTLSKALNRAYGIQRERPFWQERLISIALVITVGLTVVVLSNLLLFGDALLNYLGRLFSLDIQLVKLLTESLWVVIFLLLTILGAMAYAVCPNFSKGERRLIAVLPGAVTFSMLWMLISQLFSLYVDNMGKFNQVYGALGAVVILMIWMYWSSVAILVGGELNSLLNKKKRGAMRPVSN